MRWLQWLSPRPSASPTSRYVCAPCAVRALNRPPTHPVACGASLLAAQNTPRKPSPIFGKHLSARNTYLDERTCLREIAICGIHLSPRNTSLRETPICGSPRVCSRFIFHIRVSYFTYAFHIPYTRFIFHKRVSYWSRFMVGICFAAVLLCRLVNALSDALTDVVRNRRRRCRGTR